MLRPLLWSCALAAALAFTPAAPGQDVKPAEGGRGAVHRMEIINGSSRAVRYFGEGISEGERASLRDLERAEDEVNYLHNLQTLRSRYVAGELDLMARRQQVEEELYGQTITTTTSSGLLAALNPGLVAYPYYGYGYPYYRAGAYRAPYYAPMVYPLVTERTTITRGLGQGAGDTSPLEVALADLITKQATPEALASAERNYRNALSRAYQSDSIRVALGAPREGGVVPVEFGEEKMAPITMTLKDGQTVSGSSMKSEGEWFILDSDKETVRVRQSDVVRINERKAAPEKK